MENTDIPTNCKPIKGIIFDYGGTIDSRGDHWSWIIRDAYEAENIPLSLENFREAYVYAERELARTRHILPHHNFHDLLYIKMRIELQYLVDHDLLKPDAVELYAKPLADYCYDAARNAIAQARPVLEELSSRYPMVLVSNFYGNVEAVLTDFDLRRYFKEIIESAVVGVRKPDPAIFDLGVKALGLPAENVLVVGDSYRKDIQPAESLGCQVLWLKGKGWTADEDAVIHPSIITDLREVLKVAL